MELKMIRAILNSHDSSKEKGLIAIRMVLESLSDLDMGKLISDMRKACDGEKAKTSDKSINYNNLLASVFAIKDSGGDLVRLYKTEKSAEKYRKQLEKDHSYVSFYIDEEKIH